MKKLCSQLFVTFLFLNCTYATAQTDLTNLNLDQLMNIEVTSAEKQPEKLFTTPAAIYVITAVKTSTAAVRQASQNYYAWSLVSTCNGSRPIPGPLPSGVFNGLNGVLVLITLYLSTRCLF